MEEYQFRAPEDSPEYEDFFNAASHGDVLRLKATLLPSLDVNALGADLLQGRGALHMAAESGSVPCIQCLLARGAKVDLRNSETETPLHEAAFSARPEAIKALLDAGADINLETGDYCFTALHNVLKYKYTVTEQQIETIELLLDRGLDVNADCDQMGSTVIDQASGLRSVELMRVLLDRGARINNALSGAVLVDDYNMVKFLLSRGAKIIVSRKGLFVGSVDSVSAISSAAGSGSIEVLRMLLSHADEADIKGRPEALNCAAAGGKSDCLNMLIDHGFDVNAFTKVCWIGETPLLAVCKSQKPNPHVLKTLLDQGADTSIQASDGDTPLHATAQWSDPSSVQQLLSAGAGTSLLNNQGSTPLIQLAYKMSGVCLDRGYYLDGRGTNPRLETFTLVLQNTVDVSAKNNKGDTALHALATGRLAGVMGQGRIEAAMSLVGKRGVHVVERNREGKTAGELFAENDVEGLFQGNAELTRLLAC